MANKEMETLTVGETTYEMADAAARVSSAELVEKANTIYDKLTAPDYFQEIVERTISECSMPDIEVVGFGVFAHCYGLTSVYLPACTIINDAAFEQCSSLTSANFPVCTSIGGWAFCRCSNLTSVDFPECTSIGGNAFAGCSNLTSVSFPACTTISFFAFYDCSSLTSITIAYSSVCTLVTPFAFDHTPMSDSTYTGAFGSIYVPASLVDAYKTATNWSYYSSRITSIVT